MIGERQHRRSCGYELPRLEYGGRAPSPAIGAYSSKRSARSRCASSNASRGFRLVLERGDFFERRGPRMSRSRFCTSASRSAVERDRARRGDRPPAAAGVTPPFISVLSRRKFVGEQASGSRRLPLGCELRSARFSSGLAALLASPGTRARAASVSLLARLDRCLLERVVDGRQPIPEGRRCHRARTHSSDSACPGILEGEVASPRARRRPETPPLDRPPPPHSRWPKTALIRPIGCFLSYDL